MQQLQEADYASPSCYRAGSPHLLHRELHDQLAERLRSALEHTVQRSLPMTVLEIGAGEGSFTEAMLATGYCVTATEMSRPSIEYLERRFGRNPNFAARFDADGSLSVLGDQRFSLVVCASVLHHIPDYVLLLRNVTARHLARGGGLITFQDPMWYPGMHQSVRVIDRTAYLHWRLFQGNYGRGLRTRLRRMRHIYDDANPADAVEYHVVRQGVNQTAILEVLAPTFDECRVFTYWSTQSGAWQRLGQVVGLRNTFGLTASGFRGPTSVKTTDPNVRVISGK